MDLTLFHKGLSNILRVAQPSRRIPPSGQNLLTLSGHSDCKIPTDFGLIDGDCLTSLKLFEIVLKSGSQRKTALSSPKFSCCPARTCIIMAFCRIATAHCVMHR